jgi:hypothetical protein
MQTVLSTCVLATLSKAVALLITAPLPTLCQHVCLCSENDHTLAWTHCNAPRSDLEYAAQLKAAQSESEGPPGEAGVFEGPLAIGAHVDGTVHEVASYGLVVDIQGAEVSNRMLLCCG